MSGGRIRKSYRNFILSRISQLQKDQAFIDVKLTNGRGEIVNAHKIVLAGLSALLKEALASSLIDFEDSVTIIAPDFDMKTLEYFVLLVYGLAAPSALSMDLEESILELCQLLGLPCATTTVPIIPLEPQVPAEFQELDKVRTQSIFESRSRNLQNIFFAILKTLFCSSSQPTNPGL